MHANQTSDPPLARIEPERLEKHGHLRTDNYYWMKEKTDEFLRYVEAEDEYTDRVMAHTVALQKKLLKEIKDRIKQDDVSVPYRFGDYLYFHRYHKAQEYPAYCRKHAAAPQNEEVILDVTELDSGQPYLKVGGWEVSAGQDILAYAVDEEGGGVYTLRFRDLARGETLADEIPEVTDSFAWANDNQTLFYVRMDKTQRPYRVHRHKLGTHPQDDELLFEEKDKRYSIEVTKTKSRKYVLIDCSFSQSSEFWYLDAERPESPFVLFQGREPDHEYDIDHCGSWWFILTSFEARNFRLMKTTHPHTEKQDWREVVAHQEETFLEGFELFRTHVVLAGRRRGLTRFHVLPMDGSPGHTVGFDEPTYEASMEDNYELDSRVLRFTYSSLVTPESVYDYALVARTKECRKTEAILGGFLSSHYRLERLWAPTKDGTTVPVSLVSRKEVALEGHSPLLLTAYGAYGISGEPSFDSALISLLDRGFVYAIAHVRGGMEFGRAWYDEGRKLEKKNTFTDFIACARHLIQEGYTSPEKLFAIGGSAGGLLVAVVAQAEPDLFRGLVAEVPFVDVVTTMLDPEIPLVTSEYEEWGDPNNREAYDYMLSYSPYDKDEATRYPHLLVTTALEDNLVPPWEPVKWVARLRVNKTDGNRLLLKSVPSHHGRSGRLKQYEETAFHYAFFLDLAGGGRGRLTSGAAPQGPGCLARSTGEVSA